MSLHVGDYLKETMHLDSTLHGAYLLFILHLWAKGTLPDDDVQLAMIARMSPTQWRRARPILQAFFCDGWRHERTEKDIAAATENYKKYARAGRASGQARAAKKNEHRSNDVSNDVGNERPQSFEQPRTDNQEVREGDGARARDPVSPEAFELATAYRKAINVDPDDPRWIGLPYTAQVWVARGYNRTVVLAVGSALAARYGPSNARNRQGGHAGGGTNGTDSGFATAAIFHARAASET